MILVFGGSGQVASELRRLEAGTAVDRTVANLENPDACARVITDTMPRAVINAAAYTAVDRAEGEEALATLINADAPLAMAKACKGLDIPFIHLSTDYVFDGRGRKPKYPEDPASPVNAYGRSKLAGEDAIRSVGGKFVILRTSWVFSAHGTNFVKTMLRLANSRKLLSIVDDQVGGPTSARAIAFACGELANRLAEEPELSGTYHFSGSPDVSWYEFAKEIFSQVGAETAVDPIPTSGFPTPALRPLNSRLNCESLEKRFGIERPNWRSDLSDVLNEIRGQQ